MANKFLTNVELDAGLVDGSNSTGTSGYLLSSTGTATSWVDPAAVSVGESEQVHIACKNTSGVAISKGDPVYITGTVGTSYKIEIAKADASDSAKMPAVGLAETDLAINAEGFVIVSGILKNLTTDPLSTSDGTPSSNDTVYVKAGGGLTRTKPTGSGNLIQNVGKVGRVNSANAGSLAVSTIMRTNDVPNLTTGKIWVGSSTYTTESTVVHLDEANTRMGIGTNSPAVKLHIGPGTAPSSTTEELRIQTGVSSGYGGTAIVNLLTGQYGNSGIYFGDQATYSNQPAYIEYQDSPTTLTYKAPVTSGSHIFKIGTSEAMRVAYNSNVGIGTTSPTRALQVIGTDGAARFYYHSSFTNAQYPVVDIGMMTSGTAADGFGPKINFRMGENGYDGYVSGSIGTVRNGADGTHNMTFGTTTSGSTSTKMTITNAGDVGIGTTSPSSKLQVFGDLTVGDDGLVGSWINVIAAGSGQDAGIRFGSESNTDSKAAIYTNTSNSDLHFDVTETTRMLIDSATGNVGIGTTSPTEKLFVNGGNAKIEFPGTVMLKLNSDTSFPSVQIQAERQGGTSPPMGQLRWDSNPGATGMQLHYWNGYTENSLRLDGSNFRVINNGSERMRITSTGNVGIGTTSPGEKLEVNGTVKATATTDAYKGYIKSVITAGYNMKSATTAYQYIPYNSYILTASQAYYNRTVAAYNGRVKKIIVKRIDGASADATGMKFKKEINGTVNATEYTATVLSGSGNFQATYNFANSDFTFSAGDSIGVLMQSSGGTGMIGGGAIQIVLEYNIT